ncbi:MAG: hypothetical protein ABWY66_04970 [Xanthobacteraceae bacterium]|jgi:cytochrome bd-type quinol oxidase subunit 2
MQTSIFLAKLIGPVMLVIAAAILKDRDGFRAMGEQLLSSRPLIFIAGMIPLVVGLSIVLTHNVWTANWRVLITIFGWFAIFVGCYRILFPRLVASAGSNMIAKPATMPAVAAVLGLLGAIFCFYGYFR